jgi:hypothetical protein
MAIGESAWESLESWESESEAAEARTPVRRPSTQPSFRPRPAPTPPNAPQNFVTQLQLEASLARSDSKIKTVADGVSTIQARVAALVAGSKREAEERKKTLDTQGKDLNQKLQMLALLPMLVKAPTIQNPKDSTNQPLLLSDGITPIKAISAPDDSTLDALLPLLLVTGMGGTGGLNFGADGSGDGGSMLMLALILAMSNK